MLNFLTDFFNYGLTKPIPNGCLTLPSANKRILIGLNGCGVNKLSGTFYMLNFLLFCSILNFMRKLLLSLILLSCFTGLQAQDIINTFLGKDLLPDKYIQANKITRQDIYEYTLTRKGIADSVFLGAINYYYNHDRRLAEEVYFDRNNFLFKKNIYSFNIYGSVSKKVQHSYWQNKLIRERKETLEFGYDTAGRITEDVSYDSDTLFVTTQKREYNGNGDLYKISQKTNKDAYYITNLASYDNDHNLANIDYLSSQKRINYTYVFTTDFLPNGDKVLHLSKNNDEFCTYKFNKYEQFIEWGSFKREGLSKTTYVQKVTYSADGVPYAFIFYVNGKMKKMYKFYYHN
jgi:hypothetical protein